MKRVLWLSLFLVPSIAAAQLVQLTEQSQPYELVPVETAPGVETSFLGQLEGYPIMYDILAEDPFTLTASVRQLARGEATPFSLIVIRQNDRGGGVQEVARMNVDPAEWEQSRDSAVGLTFLESPVLSEAVEPGVYRIEVSTPENAGRYQLQLGETEQSVGYFDRLAATRQTQQFFGFGLLMMLGSQLVYTPLLIGLLLYVGYRMGRVFYRKKDDGAA